MKKFLSTERGAEYVRNMRKAHPDGTVTKQILKMDSKGRLEKVGERKVHINEIIAQEEKR